LDVDNQHHSYFQKNMMKSFLFICLWTLWYGLAMESHIDSKERLDTAMHIEEKYEHESAQTNFHIDHLPTFDSTADQNNRQLQSKKPNTVKTPVKPPVRIPSKSPVRRTRIPVKPTRIPVKRTRIPVKATKVPVAPSRVGELEPTEKPQSIPLQIFIPTSIPSPMVSKKPPQIRFVPTPPPRDTGRSCPTPESSSWQVLADASGGLLKKCFKDSDCADYHPEDGPACCSHPYCICATVYDYYQYDFQCLSF
jgi:hypothetical protein